MTERDRKTYFIRRMCGSGNTISRVADKATFFVLAFLCAFLIWYSHPLRTFLSLLSAGAVGMIQTLLFRAKLRRFTRHETERVRQILFAEKLLLMPRDELHRAVRSVATGPFLFIRRQSPVTTDVFMDAYRPDRTSSVCLSTAEWEPDTVRFVAEHFPQMTVYDRRETYRLLKDVLPVKEEEVDAYILQAQERFKTKRRTPPKLPRGAAAASKYLAVGVLLLGLSFFVQYSLYYRLLSVVAFSLAGMTGMSLLYKNRAKENAPP